MSCIEMNTGSYGGGGPSHITHLTNDALRSITVPSNRADSDENQEGDLSDVSSQASDLWSEAPNDSSDGPVDLDDMPDRNPQTIFAMSGEELMQWFNNHLRNGDMARAEEITLFFPDELALDHQRYADVVGFGPGVNSNYPSVTAIHDLILRDNLEEQMTMYFVITGQTHSIFALNSFEINGADMYATSSGYTDSRIAPGFPTVDPVFYAAHNNRNPAILTWYLNHNHFTGRHLIHNRPLLWWLVRHVDAVPPRVLMKVANRRDINFGVECIAHHGSAGVKCQFDFTPLELALIRQPRYVLDTLRKLQAKTNLETLAPWRITKLYRPGFKNRRPGRKAHAFRMKRRSSFGFAEEALSAEEALRVRHPVFGDDVPEDRDEVSADVDGEPSDVDGEPSDRNLFWKGKSYGPLPRPHLRYSRTMSAGRAAMLFWLEAEAKMYVIAPSKRALKRVKITIPANLKHNSRLPGPSSS